MGLWGLISILVFPYFLFRPNKWLTKRWLQPDIFKGKGQRPIWVHTLSVGEFLSAREFLKELRLAFGQTPIVVSTSTQKAHEYALVKKDPLIDAILYAPLDFYPVIKKFLYYLDPMAAIFVETDLWPCTLWLLGRANIPVFVVNGRISPRTYKRYRLFSGLLRNYFKPVKRWMVQSQLDGERLREVGIIDNRNIIVTGNLKFDTSFEPLSQADATYLRNNLGLSPEDRLIVAGSTHPGEEEILGDVILGLAKAHWPIRLLIAPRDINRAHKIEGIFQERGLITRLRSSLERSSMGSWDVMVLDTIGELKALYGIAQIAFVGGSLVPIGGHNILEPASHGVPVLFGPYMHNFAEISQLILEQGGGIMVRDKGELYQAINHLLGNPDLAMHMGQRARTLYLSHKGASARALKEILKVLEENFAGRDVI